MAHRPEGLTPNEPPERDGTAFGYAHALSKLTELVSPVWDVIQWGAVFNWRFLGGCGLVFVLTLFGLIVYAAAQGPWLCRWLTALGFTC